MIQPSPEVVKLMELREKCKDEKERKAIEKKLTEAMHRLFENYADLYNDLYK